MRHPDFNRIITSASSKFVEKAKIEFEAKAQRAYEEAVLISPDIAEHGFSILDFYYKASDSIRARALPSSVAEWFIPVYQDYLDTTGIRRARFATVIRAACNSIEIVGDLKVLLPEQIHCFIEPFILPAVWIEEPKISEETIIIFNKNYEKHIQRLYEDMLLESLNIR